MTTYGPRISIRELENPFNPTYRVQWAYRKGYVQKPRTGKPNELEIQKAVFTRPDLWNAYCDAPNHPCLYYLVYPGPDYFLGRFGLREDTQARNNCYSKFRDAVSNVSASLGANLAEWRQSVNMIATDANILRRAWNALRSGRFREFKRILGLTLNKGESPWSKPEIAGSLWLQYHFGWEPLVKDIFESVKILEGTLPSHDVRARASSAGSYFSTDNYGGNNWEIPEFRYRYHMQGRVNVTNPNLHMATALGLTNPAAVLWEVVPFSFVVDWFLPVGEFLNSWSDFLGLEFVDAFTTRSHYARGSTYSRALEQYGGGKYTIQESCEARYVKRELAILGPAFPFPSQFKGLSVARGATAIALLIGALSSERRYFSQTYG